MRQKLYKTKYDTLPDFIVCCLTSRSFQLHRIENMFIGSVGQLFLAGF